MNRVVLVSGGNRGLGSALVQSFLDDGQHCVATFSRNRTAFIDTIARHPERQERFSFKTLDITNRQEVDAYLQEIDHRFGPVSILVNNAGLGLDGVLALQSEEQIDRLLRTNLQSTVHLTRGCVRHMLRQKWGRVVNISSVASLTGFRGLSVYSMTKAGLDGFTRSLARELGSRNITVNSVAPGFLETAMTETLTEKQKAQIVRRTPVGRLGRPEDVVPLVRFLCSDEACFISGQTIAVDGGETA